MKHFTSRITRYFRDTVLILVNIAVTLLFASGPIAPAARAAGGRPPAYEANPAVEPPGLNDPQELESFLDSLIMSILDEEHIAGATVAVVKDGRLFFAKGYGYADVEAKVPVDPERTLFRVGSINKLFTWTAVMQLVEQGRLDLEADVNQYLDFTIPATFAEPVRLKHLMTHTPGFENTAFGFAATRPEGMVPLGDWLADNLPARAWAPGQVAAYSNYGTALAGYIVQRVAGMPYEDYIEQNILAPLGMTHSTLRQPVPAVLEDNLSHGYQYLDGAFQSQGFEYVKLFPAGGLSASATDMARFMIAHLQHGRYCERDCANGESRILVEATGQRMQSRLWAADERLNGMAHGFVELDQNGTRVVGHPGDTPLFHSVLALLPEQNAGLFFSYNTGVYGQAMPVLEAFMDHYYPSPAAGISALPGETAESTEHLAGLYQHVRYAYSKGGKIQSMFGLGAFPVQAGSQGELIIDKGYGPQRYVQVAPLYFEAVESENRLVFHKDDAGKISYLFFSDDPTMTYRKKAGYETQSFNLLLLAVCVVLFLSVLVVEPLRLLVGWIRRRRQTPQPPRAKTARAVLAALAILALAMIAGLYWQIIELGATIPMGERGLLPVLGGISILVVGLAAANVVLAGLAWRRRWWGVAGRIYYSLVTVASIAFVWFLAFWNQIGWQWW